MIGQSTINVNNGATKRLSGIATALFLLSFFSPAPVSSNKFPWPR